MGADRSRLLASAREWFERDDQIGQYASQAAGGVSDLEAGLLQRLPEPPADVLDVGCGAGRIAVPLALRGYQVTGVDVGSGLLARARDFADERGARVRLETVSATELPFADGVFDAVLSIKQYCYLPGALLRRAYLRELARIARPGGVMILTGYFVPSEAEALEVLNQDEEHTKAIEGFSDLEPLDTFSAGRGFVHWFTREQFHAEVSSLGRPVEFVDDEDQLQIGFILRF